MRVVQPETAEEIGRLLAEAQAKGIRTTVRGGGTLEQILPTEGNSADLLLDLSGMNRILSIEKGNLLARVEAGAVTAAIQAAVEAEGLFYPPDPDSLEASTIGGNIACGAAGPRQLRYGGTRAFVLGLEVVLPTGERLRTGANMQKSVAGYDMTRFFIGSGSRFGVVTGAILRLLPKPQDRQTVLCGFSGFSAGASVALAVMRSGITPSAMELLDLPCLEVDRDAWISLGLPTRTVPKAASLLLVELDGVKASVDRQRAQIERFCADQNGAEVLTLTAAEVCLQAWRLRRRLLPRLIGDSQSWALAVAAVGLERLLAPFSPDEPPLAQLADRSARLACFAHAGSGVLNLFVALDAAKGSEVDAALGVVRRILHRLHVSGGTLLRTYGPGRLALGEEGKQAPPLLHDLDAIRRSFDPRGIMVP